MDIKSKEGIIFIVQVDHLTGECIGQSIDEFYKAGASNVQVIPSITKKNRPSYIFFIDCKPKFSDSIENIIARELTTGGWHKINTTHKYLNNQIIRKDITIIYKQKSIKFTVQAKEINHESIKPEYDNILELKKKMNEVFEKEFSYNEIYNLVEIIFTEDKYKEINFGCFNLRLDEQINILIN